jgi:hypothetical protein
MDDEDMEGTFTRITPDSNNNFYEDEDEENVNTRKRKATTPLFELENEEVEVEVEIIKQQSSRESINIDNINYDKFLSEILANYMKSQETFSNDDCESISVYILKCATVIKNYNKIYNYVKKNRLNFFN